MAFSRDIFLSFFYFYFLFFQWNEGEKSKKDNKWAAAAGSQVVEIIYLLNDWCMWGKKGMY